MHPSFIRRDLGTLIPPKIATPNSLVCLSISGDSPANFAYRISTAFLPHLPLKCRLKSLLILDYSPWKFSLAAAEPRYNLSSNSTASYPKAPSL